MNNDKVNSVLRSIIDRILSLGLTPESYPHDGHLPYFTLQAHIAALRHALAMCEHAIDMPEEKLEKKMRWLGFIQGVLWMTGVRTISNSKYDNIPDDERDPI
jgi:hypothetical protein